MDTFVRKVPLGVTAAVCPFNFPGALYDLLTRKRRR